MQSDDQSGGAKRPRATIEGSAREISKKSADPADETAHVETTGEDREISTADTSPGLRSIITVSAISGISAVLLVFAILALMRFASEPSAQALRLLVGADGPA
ncbi:MAG: hypothetical protein HKN60_03925, partial [Rhizobiales bacterium]|nr:hypothetical protein [Hyphomicrobiales bacterium]